MTFKFATMLSLHSRLTLVHQYSHKLFVFWNKHPERKLSVSHGFHIWIQHYEFRTVSWCFCVIYILIYLIYICRFMNIRNTLVFTIYYYFYFRSCTTSFCCPLKNKEITLCLGLAYNYYYFCLCPFFSVAKFVLYMNRLIMCQIHHKSLSTVLWSLERTD